MLVTFNETLIFNTNTKVKLKYFLWLKAKNQTSVDNLCLPIYSQKIFFNATDFYHLSITLNMCVKKSYYKSYFHQRWWRILIIYSSNLSFIIGDGRRRVLVTVNHMTRLWLVTRLLLSGLWIRYSGRLLFRQWKRNCNHSFFANENYSMEK